jgi:hypothetical protein
MGIESSTVLGGSMDEWSPGGVRIAGREDVERKFAFRSDPLECRRIRARRPGNALIVHWPSQA